jgi:hypothetical protein
MTKKGMQMATLIQRLTLMNDQDGAKEVQQLLDKAANAQSQAAWTASENRLLRAAIAAVLNAADDTARRAAEKHARDLLAVAQPPWAR